jgi:hypothetical protein
MRELLGMVVRRLRDLSTGRAMRVLLAGSAVPGGLRLSPWAGTRSPCYGVYQAGEWMTVTLEYAGTCNLVFRDLVPWQPRPFDAP